MVSDRQLLRGARNSLDGWTYTARDRAYRELFEGDDAAVTAEERRLLDHVDSELALRSGDGIWGVDEYAIVLGDSANHALTVVCTRHPYIPAEWSRGEDSLTDPEREQFNDLLWDYCERVRRYIQQEVDAFVESGGVVTA